MSKGTYPSDFKDRFALRLPEGMRDEIARFAERNGRSMNSEIVARLEKSLEPERKVYGLSGADPYRTILDANAAIARHLSEVETAMQALGKQAGKMKVAEEKPTYTAVVNMLPPADREVLTIAHGLSNEARASLIALLKQTSKKS